MTALSLSREEFAAKRRGEQDKIVERLSGVIGASFSTGDIQNLKAALANIYKEVWSEEKGDTAPIRNINVFLEAVTDMLSHANEDSSVETTALALANYVLNYATNDAYKHQGIEMEWVSMNDENVRHSHKEADGQRQLPGEKFTVGESKMLMPGDVTAPIEEWINCRCSLKPVQKREASAALTAALQPMASEGFLSVSRALFDEAIATGMAVQSGVREEDGVVLYDLKPTARMHSNGLVFAADVPEDALSVMAIPAEGDSAHEVSIEDTHATLLYFGSVPPTDESDDGAIDAVKAWAHQIAADAQPFTAEVQGVEPLGDGGAIVWMLKDSDLNGLFEGMLSDDRVRQAYEDSPSEKYDTYTPHVTIGYDIPASGDMIEAVSAVTEITFDRLAVWHGSERTEYPLGEPMTEAAAETEPVIEETPTEEAPPVDDRIPWHGVLAPEGVRSGDGRMFSNLGRTRDLPLPLTWQETSADGHDQNITVAQIEWVEMRDNLMWGGGHFLSSVDEADEAIGLIAEFGKFGVSVDADDIGSATYDEASETETYDDPRVSSACIVSIPAFAEAFVAIGPDPLHDEDQANGDVPPEDLPEEEALAAAGVPLLQMAGVPESFKQAAFAKVEAEREAAARLAEDWDSIEQFKDLAPGVTEDGPGWLTHPVDTDRLRDYWVRGPGAAKIGWGVSGDFNRCRVNVAEYVKPQYLNGYCANRHYDALHVWPGQEAANSGVSMADQIAQRLAAGEELPAHVVSEPAPTLTLVASGGKAPGYFAPSEFFSEPLECDPDDGVVIEAANEDGLLRTFGYIAEWGVCHIGYDGMCKEAPPSPSNYAYFRKGVVNTPDGAVRVGALTAATGHANPRLKAMPAAAHYDDTGSVWALVATGENARGIWFSGLVKPGADEQLLNDVVASGRLSGDWRPIGNDLELMAALTVNVPGFPIVPTTTAAHDGRQLSLVAAGVPAPKIEESPAVTLDLNDTEGLSLIASLVVDEMESRKARRDRLDALKEKVNS
jgi:2'-5' RNA ligase